MHLEEIKIRSNPEPTKITEELVFAAVLCDNEYIQKTVLFLYIFLWEMNSISSELFTLTPDWEVPVKQCIKYSGRS